MVVFSTQMLRHAFADESPQLAMLLSPKERDWLDIGG